MRSDTQYGDYVPLILLKADQSSEGPGWVDEAIAEAVETSQPMVSRVRKQYLEEGLEAALNRRPPNRKYRHKLDGEQEARLLALAYSQPPEGQACWSLRLLAEQLVELEIVDEVSCQTVGRRAPREWHDTFGRSTLV